MTTEEFTAEVILERLLSRIPEGLDKREGSIIYDALAPLAWEMASAYRLLFSAYDEAFILTATGVSLDKRVEEMGIVRREATKTLAKAEFKDTAGEPLDIDAGSRFMTLDPAISYTYVVVDKVDSGIYQVEAIETGAGPNGYIDALSPVTHISGLGSAEITEILIPGEDIESDDDLRARYLSYIANELQDGNVAQYIYWADNYNGIGQVKVFPLWQGANTVKVSILDAENQKASQTLIDAFQDYLDPGAEGLGNGVAPIGAKVTVSTATEITVNVSMSVQLKDGYLLDNVKSNISIAIAQYLTDKAYSRNAIYYVDIGSAILGAEGVSAVSNLQLNGSLADITLGNEEIGKLGTLTVSEVSG